MLSVAFAVLAALLNAVAAVLQRKGGQAQPDERAFSPRLLWELVRGPAWLAGVATLVLGFVAQAVALTAGGVARVQSLLVAELPFALLLGSLVFGGRPRRVEWLSIVALTAGLALFLSCLSPEGGDPLGAPAWAWALGLGVCAVVVGAAVVLGRALSGHRRAALLGIATGGLFGLDAALTTAIGTSAARGGPAGVFTAWQAYLLLVLAPVAFFLLQNALQAGSLVASQPGFTLANPVVSVGWGVLVFGERVRGGWWTVGTLAGAVLIAGGTLLLARSPLLSGQR
ncbi:DMT family transporter [Pseudonocardia acaciae]|uniref:DMT family transporter n=1 Tax=Pseudonocardia acaciae TaxID=551276 RepID=UPI0005686F1C|nr:DMT family transporter [Pseudonocardia acaciae]